MKLHRITAAEMLPGFRVSLTFDDGFHGIAPLAETVAIGGALTAIRDNPAAFRVEQEGRAVVWTDTDGEEVDLCADALRLLAERSAAQAAE
jgi:hypothetical protein